MTNLKNISIFGRSDIYSGRIYARRAINILSNLPHAIEIVLDGKDRNQILDLFINSRMNIFSLEDFLQTIITLQLETGAAILTYSLNSRKKVKDVQLLSADEISIFSNENKIYLRDIFGNDIDIERTLFFTDYPSSDITLKKSTRNDLIETLNLERDIFKYNSSFFKQGIKYSLFLIFKRALNEEQRKQILNILAKGSPAVGGAHLPHILSGEIDIKSFSEIFKDFDFLKGKEEIKEEIATAFGIPPSLLSMFKRTPYNTAKYQLKLFWQVTAKPRLNRIKAILNTGFLSRYTQSTLVLDFSNIEEIYGDINESLDTIKYLREANISWEKIAEITNLPKLASLETKDQEKNENSKSIKKSQNLHLNPNCSFSVTPEMIEILRDTILSALFEEDKDFSLLNSVYMRAIRPELLRSESFVTIDLEKSLLKILEQKADSLIKRLKEEFEKDNEISPLNFLQREEIQKVLKEESFVILRDLLERAQEVLNKMRKKESLNSRALLVQENEIFSIEKEE